MTLSAPDELMLVAGLTAAPDGSGNKIVAVVAGHCGDAKDGQKVLDRIRSFGTVVADELGPISYTALNGMLDAGAPAGSLNHWKAAFLPELSDAAIDAIIAADAKGPLESSQVVLEHFHGAASRVPVDATAYALRETGYNTLVLARWTDRAANAANTAWCRATFAALQPFAGARRYMNYLDHDEESVAAARLPTVRTSRASGNSRSDTIRTTSFTRTSTFRRGERAPVAHVLAW